MAAKCSRRNLCLVGEQTSSESVTLRHLAGESSSYEGLTTCVGAGSWALRPATLRRGGFQTPALRIKLGPVKTHSSPVSGGKAACVLDEESTVYFGKLLPPATHAKNADGWLLYTEVSSISIAPWQQGAFCTGTTITRSSIQPTTYQHIT